MVPQTDARLICLWGELRSRLALWFPDWLDVVSSPSKQGGLECVVNKAALPNTIVFEAFAVALLSGNTRWERIERIRDELRAPFYDFDPQKFSRLSDADIAQKILPWFCERKSGSAGLHAGLLRLRATASKLSDAREGDHAAHKFLLKARAETDGSSEQLAVLLATSKTWKLPGFGVALAAEALRNLGFDLCKPDRHVLRAVGSWSLIEYSRWDQRGAFTAPQAKPAELLATMLMVRSLAEANGVNVSFANSVIWTAGAVSGARLTNREFRELSRICG